MQNLHATQLIVWSLYRAKFPNPLPEPLLRLLCLCRSFFSKISLCSSRNVTSAQNQPIVSTNINVKNTLFFSASPPHPEGIYAGLCVAW